MLTETGNSAVPLLGLYFLCRQYKQAPLQINLQRQRLV
jgi:hypothetical protein